jgi:hypothetical protein
MDNLEDEERHGYQQEGSHFPKGDRLQNFDADQDLAPSLEVEAGTYC